MRILILLLLLSQFCFSQDAKLKIDTSMVKIDPQTITLPVKTCDEANNEAVADFNKGIYNYFTYGWAPTISNADEKANRKIRAYLRKKYSLNYEYKGCILFPGDDCYSETMVKLIETEFGAGFIDKKMEEARKLFLKE